MWWKEKLLPLESVRRGSELNQIRRKNGGSKKKWEEGRQRGGDRRRRCPVCRLWWVKKRLQYRETETARDTKLERETWGGGLFSWLVEPLLSFRWRPQSMTDEQRTAFTDIIKWPYSAFIRPFTLQTHTHTHAHTRTLRCTGRCKCAYTAVTYRCPYNFGGNFELYVTPDNSIRRFRKLMMWKAWAQYSIVDVPFQVVFCGGFLKHDQNCSLINRSTPDGNEASRYSSHLQVKAGCQESH